jgi:hypothetical protein
MQGRYVPHLFIRGFAGSLCTNQILVCVAREKGRAHVKKHKPDFGGRTPLRLAHGLCTASTLDPANFLRSDEYRGVTEQ